MENRPDIFDKIMALSVFSAVSPFYKKHKSVLLYLFFGGLTTIVSIGTFALFLPVTDALIANLISWVAAVSFAYITNRTWVFTSKAKNGGVFREALTFYGGRVFTLALEEAILYIFITLLASPPLVIKIFAQFVVLVLNYVISKLVVFKKR